LFLLFLNERSLLVVCRLLGLLVGLLLGLLVGLLLGLLVGLLVEIPHEYGAHPPVLDEFSLCGSWGGIIRQGEKRKHVGGEFFPTRGAAGEGI
jgi:hypothetical protein